MHTTTPGIVHRSAPVTRQDLRAARDELSTLTGWPVNVDELAGRLLLTTGANVDAITMPAFLGERVLARLRITLQAGPVIATPGGGWWTFITELATAPRPVIPNDLLALRVRMAPRGPYTVLPPTIAQPGHWSWIAFPQRGHQPPMWAAVIAVTRRIALNSVHDDE